MWTWKRLSNAGVGQFGGERVVWKSGLTPFIPFILVLFLFNSSVNAGVFEITPPASLNIDSQSINAGVFTLETFSGFDMSLAETIILNSGSADNIPHAANIGSGVTTTLLSYPGTYPLVQFDYNFDSTVPDLAAISANVLSATTNFIISLPFSSATTGFFEVIDFNGVASFHTTEASLDFSASGTTNIDLFGDASIFAAFGPRDTILSPTLFQAHGTVLVPEAQTYALMLVGLGLVGWRARRRGKRDASLSNNGRGQ